MNTNTLLYLAQEALQVVVLLCLPALATSLVVGLVVSLLQATTQMQDQTLSFIPKIAAVGVALYLFGGWMLGVAVRFAHHAFEMLPRLAK